MIFPLHGTVLWRIRVWAVLAVFALLVMEAMEISLWYQAVFEPVEVSFLGVSIILFAIFLGSYLLVQEMATLRLRMIIRQTVFFGWILLAGFASLKLLVYPHTPLGLFELVSMPVRYILHTDVPGVNFFHLIAIIMLIWRGVSLARSPVTLTSTQASFQLGLVVVLLYGMIYAPLHPVEATVGLYVFLLCGLLAMSMARIANLSEIRGGRIPRFSAGWVVSILLAGLAVVGLAILAGWLSSGRVVEAIAFLVVILFSILTALVLILISPLLSVLAHIMTLIADILQQLLERLRNLPFSEQMQKLVEALNKGLGKIVPFVLAGRAIFLFAVLVILVAVILLALYLHNIRQKFLEEEGSESVQSTMPDNFLRKLFQRILRDARNLRLRGAAQLLAAARVRQIYRQLMTLSSKLGEPRPPANTPLEFLPRLESLFPEEQAGLNTITSAYLKVRYGAYIETREEVEAVEAAWDRVRRDGKSLLAARKAAQKRMSKGL